MTYAIIENKASGLHYVVEMDGQNNITRASMRSYSTTHGEWVNAKWAEDVLQGTGQHESAEALHLMQCSPLLIRALR